MSANDIEERLAALLERRGYQVTEAVERAIDTFVARCEDSVDRRGRAMDPDDEISGEAEDDGTDATPTRTIDCPHCGERLPIALDVSNGEQDGIQDCEVCCRPIHVSYSVHAGRVVGFRADPA